MIVSEMSRYLYLFAAAFVLGLVVNTPARLIPTAVNMESWNIDYDSIKGTAWNGQVLGARMSQVALGDIDFALSPFSWDALGPVVEWSAQNGLISGSGRIVDIVSSQKTFEDTQLEIDLRVLQVGLPVTGTMVIDGLNIVAGPDGCAKGQATARLRGALTIDPPGEEAQLKGTLTCINQRIEGTLEGRMGQWPTVLMLEMRANGALTYQVRIENRNALQSSVLQALGFVRKGDTFEMVRSHTLG